MKRTGSFEGAYSEEVKKMCKIMLILVISFVYLCTFGCKISWRCVKRMPKTIFPISHSGSVHTYGQWMPVEVSV